MLLTEARLRELYAAGEIDLAELERSLDIINARREARSRQPPSTTAGRPLSPDEKREMMDHAAALQTVTRSEPRGEPPKCPQCQSHLREVVENGIRTAWCRRCKAYVGPDPRQAAAPAREPGSVWVAGGIFPLGPHGIDLG